jgi:hypothetical protein
MLIVDVMATAVWIIGAILNSIEFVFIGGGVVILLSIIAFIFKNH